MKGQRKQSSCIWIIVSTPNDTERLAILLIIRADGPPLRFVSESTVYRILKKQGLITTPAYRLMEASDHFTNPTTAPNQPGKEGIRLIPFEVRNGPAIALEGIYEHAVVDGVVPIMINAYGKGDQHKFLITGSETPQSIPSWIWRLLISFSGWAIFYLIRYFQLAQSQ